MQQSDKNFLIVGHYYLTFQRGQIILDAMLLLTTNKNPTCKLINLNMYFGFSKSRPKSSLLATVLYQSAKNRESSLLAPQLLESSEGDKETESISPRKHLAARSGARRNGPAVFAGQSHTVLMRLALYNFKWVGGISLYLYVKDLF